PMFSLLAIVTLALGIGANAAVFGVVKSVLLDALPYADANRLVRVSLSLKDGSITRGPLSAGTVTDIADRQRSFSSVAAFQYGTQDLTYSSDAGPRVISGSFVGGRFFQTLGVSGVRGRTLTEADAAPGATPVAMLSFAGWQRF